MNNLSNRIGDTCVELTQGSSEHWSKITTAAVMLAIALSSAELTTGYIRASLSVGQSATASITQKLNDEIPSAIADLGPRFSSEDMQVAKVALLQANDKRNSEAAEIAKPPTEAVAADRFQDKHSDIEQNLSEDDDSKKTAAEGKIKSLNPKALENQPTDIEAADLTDRPAKILQNRSRSLRSRAVQPIQFAEAQAKRHARSSRAQGVIKRNADILVTGSVRSKQSSDASQSRLRFSKNAERAGQSVLPITLAPSL